MIYILTIKGREELVKETIDSLINVGVFKEKIKVIHGYTEYGTQNCMRSFIYKILPLMLEDEDESIYVEDGSIFVENPYKYTEGSIYWSGYIKLIWGYWIGSKCIYFSKKVLKNIKNNFREIQLQHLDRFFRNYILLHKYDEPKKESICFQMDYERANGTQKQLEKKLKYIERQRKNLINIYGL